MRWCLPAAVVLAWVIFPCASAAAPSPAPFPCVPAPTDDPQPWVHNSRVLGSFPPDEPRPQLLGVFRDSRSEHELHIWRDSTGIFGEWLSPLLDADSPASRLYDARFDAKSGALSLTARFPEAEQRFTGRIRGNDLRGTVLRLGKSEAVVLRGARSADAVAMVREGVTSRAQFECRMTLFRRY